jgi:hypothetical protein
MKNKNTWTPEKAREMAKKSAMMRKLKKEKELHTHIIPSHPPTPVIRLTAFPSPNFAMPKEIIKEQWLRSIRISIIVGFLLGFILICIDKLI